MIFNSENSLILRILIQTKCHKIHGSVLILRNKLRFFCLNQDFQNFQDFQDEKNPFHHIDSDKM